MSIYVDTQKPGMSDSLDRSCAAFAIVRSLRYPVSEMASVTDQDALDGLYGDGFQQ